MLVWKHRHCVSCLTGGLSEGVADSPPLALGAYGAVQAPVTLVEEASVSGLLIVPIRNSIAALDFIVRLMHSREPLKLDMHFRFDDAPCQEQS
eukprot:1286438-Amphidinium_carterae.1